MAKKTKAASLTIEEKLEQALVVPGYEPYKIPDNWCWTTLEYAAKWGSGGTPSRKVSDYYLGDIPWIKTGELDNDFVYETEEHISEIAISNSSAKLYPVNTVMIAMYGATIGKVGIMGVKATTNQACANAVCGNNVYYKFLFYYAISQKDAFINKGKGGAQPNISQEIIKKHEFPLAPLPEQHRIVERIESLFSKLDEAKGKAQEVIDSFETRKAAILHKAFSGELTAKWREENGVGIESWERRSINDICHSLKYGTSKKSKSEGPVIVIRMGNLKQGEIDWSDLAYTDDKEDIEKYRLSSGDVLFNRTNSAVLVGKTSIYRGDFPAIYAGYLIKLDYKHDEIIGDYLNYALNTTAAKEYCNNVKTDGVNQSNINAKKIGAFVIPVASMNEQRVIVDIISSLLKKENESKQAAEVVIDQIDTMKKAVLARAFRGELGTNDPEEENAVELLKEILSGNNNEEKAQKPKRTRIVIPKEIDSLLKTELERKIIKLFLKSETGEVSAEEIMAVSSKKFDILNTIRTLEKKHLIQKSVNNRYTKYTIVR